MKGDIFMGKTLKRGFSVFLVLLMAFSSIPLTESFADMVSNFAIIASATENTNESESDCALGEISKNNTTTHAITSAINDNATPDDKSNVRECEFIKSITPKTSVPDGYIGIYTIEDLNKIYENQKWLCSKIINNYQKSVYGYYGNYILMNNLDFSEIEFDTIGNSTNYFVGVFDGNGYELKNLSNPLFYAVADGGTVKNVSVLSKSNGIICKYLLESTIENCFVKGTITGGASGASYPSSTSAWTSSSSGLRLFSGAISAYASNESIIMNCYNSADFILSAEQSNSSPGSHSCRIETGGITGRGGKIQNSYNTGNIFIEEIKSGYPIDVNSAYVGGISGVGYIISNCYNTGDLTVDKMGYGDANWCYMGGITNFCETVNNSFNTGKILCNDTDPSSYTEISGIAFNANNINNCYNIGDLACKTPLDDDYYRWHEHNFYEIGDQDSTVSYCYYLGIPDAGDSLEQEGVALSSARMTNSESFVNFDFDSVWEFREGALYPYPLLIGVPFNDINSVPSENTTMEFLFDKYSFYQYAKSPIDSNNIILELVSSTQSMDTITFSTSDPNVANLKTCTLITNYEYTSIMEIEINANNPGKTRLIATTEDGCVTYCDIEVVESKNVLVVKTSANSEKIKIINNSLYVDGENIDHIDVAVSLTNCLSDGTTPELIESVLPAFEINDINIECTSVGGFYFDLSSSDDIDNLSISKLKYGESRTFNFTIYPSCSEIDKWQAGYSKDKYQVMYSSVKWKYGLKENINAFEAEACIDLSYVLELQEDDFSFVNSQDYFVGTDEKDAYLISNEAKKMIKWYDFVDISINSAFNWNGSCLGMSGMKSLFNNETISVLSFGDSSTYALNAPVKDGKVSNLKLRDAINIIQSSQTLIPTVAATMNFKSQDTLCEELVEAVRDIENGGILPVVIIEKPGFAAGAHAVVAYNIIEKGDNFEIYISDPNFFGMTKMTISKDYKNFKYHDGTYTKVKAIITNPDIININNIAPGLVNSEISTFSNVPLSENSTQEKYDFTVINIQGANEITVKNQKGESAIINFADETISGTLDVLDVSSVPSGDGLVRIVIGDSLNEVNTYEIACDVDAYTLTVNNNHIGASVCVEDATDSMVSFRTDGRIALDSENDINYDVALFYFNAVSDVYSANLAGKSKNIVLKYDEDGIIAEADNLSEQELIVNHYDDNLTKENIEILRFAETDSVLIAEENNSMVLYEDIEDDDFYDNIVSGTIFEYNLLEDGTIEISGIAGGNSLENIIIPECYDGYIVSGIAENCFKGNTLLSSVEISDTVTSIGEGAFRDCSNLTSVVLPNNLSLMSNMLFYGCTNLRTVTIPENVTQIGSYAFAYCSSISNISMPDSVTDIGDYVFLNCEKMANVKLSNKLKTIRGFNGCSNLASIEIPDGVLTITSYAFSGCASLQSITLPASLTSVHPMSFYECSSLTSIDVDSKNVTFCSIDGVLFSMDKTQLICYPNGKADMYYEIPSSVSVIGDYAFEYNNNLINVTIPDGITSIGYNAFSCCKKLESIVIPSTIKVIKDTAFYHCESLSNVVILGEISEIPRSCFSGCTSLKNVTLPNSVTQIKAFAFYECRNLTEITIGRNVESIAEKAFQKCVNLNIVYNCSDLDIKANSAANGYVGYYADNIYEHKMNSSEVPPSCEENGYTLHKCVLCEYSYTNNLVSSTGHKDDNGDYICDYGCGHEFEKPIEPEQPDAPDEPSADNCGHLCHKSGFMGFIWKIVRFFWKLFKMNPVCDCGVAHY